MYEKMDHHSRKTAECYFEPSYWHQCSTEPFLPLTIGQLIGQAAERWGDDEALIYPDENLQLSFKDIKKMADEIASGFLNLGLNPGDVVEIWGFNCSVLQLTFLATQRAGLITVCINPTRPIQEVLSSLKKVKAKAFVIIQEKDEEQKYSRLLNTITEISACATDNGHSVKLPDLKIVVTYSDTSYPGTFEWKQVSKMSTTDGIEKINDLQHSIQPDDTAMILFTSGSMSDPKGVLLSHHTLVNNVYFHGKVTGFNNNRHRIYSASQLSHEIGILMFILGFHFGSTSIFPNGKFNIESVINTIQKERCSFLFGVPTYIYDIMRYVQDNDLNLHYPEVILTGGAPITDKLVLEIKKVFPVKYLMIGYGTSECGWLTLNTNVQPGSANTGKLLDHLEAKIVDNDGKMIPMGKPGELWIRSSCMMKGYLDDEEKTANVITSSGWFKTGDHCSLDKDGTWKYFGRTNDRICKFGSNIYSIELENILVSHNAIQDVCVLGVPDERFGEEICAFIQTKKGKILSENDVTKFCEEKMNWHIIPKYIRFIEELPRNITGKVNRRALLDVIKKDKDYIQNSTSSFNNTEKIN